MHYWMEEKHTACTPCSKTSTPEYQLGSIQSQWAIGAMPTCWDLDLKLDMLWVPHLLPNISVLACQCELVQLEKFNNV
jgi:hypothetical protein